jgi:hypothetical protein
MQFPPGRAPQGDVIRKREAVVLLLTEMVMPGA